jgi:hypothetical protein
MSRHAPLPPSSATRWIACPGSVQAERDAPPKLTSEFAAIGTKAHELFARGLHSGLTPERLTDDPVLLRPLALALTVTRRILARRPFMVELRLQPLATLPDLWGTADIVAFAAEGPVDTIIDLKFGEAIGIEADTPQLGIYGLLAARRFGVARSGLTVWVVQPRHAHASGPARSHRYSIADLDQLETVLRQKVMATLAADAPRHAGEWCRFCAAAASCPVRQAAPEAMPTLPSAWFRPTPHWFRPA